MHLESETLYAEAKNICDQSDEKRFSVAFPTMLRAAELGSISAQFQIGLMYAEGLGTTQSLALARQWLELAAKNKHPEAPSRLSELVTWMENDAIEKKHESDINAAARITQQKIDVEEKLANTDKAIPESKMSTIIRWVAAGVVILVIKSCFFSGNSNALIGKWHKVYGGDTITFRPHDMTVRGLMEGVGTYDVKKYEPDGNNVIVHYEFNGAVQKRTFTVINSDKISSYGAEFRRD